MANVNVVSPEGDVGSLPQEQLQSAMASGYREASPEELQDHLDQQQYGSGADQAKTFLEGAAKSATFGLSTGIEKGFGAKGKDIEGRARANPIASGAGELAGLVGPSLIPGVGELSAGHALTEAGEGASRALGFAGDSTLSKIGSSAVKGAVETGLYQGGDEVSKMFSSDGQQDPSHMAGTALLDIGLSGLLGGALGAGIGTISPLWKETVGKKLGGYLDGIKSRVDGLGAQLPDATADALQKSGIDVAPEIVSGMTGSPDLERQFNILREASTVPGQDLKASLDTFGKQSGDAIVDSLGKAPQDIMAPEEMSAHQVGSNILDSFVNEIKEKVEPISKAYNDINDKFSSVPLSDADKSKIAEDIAQYQKAQGLDKSPSAPENKILQSILKELPLQETAADLKNFASNKSGEAAGQQLWHLSKSVRAIIEDGQGAAIQREIGDKAPQLLDSYTGAKAAYRNLRGVLDELNSHTHVGSYAGPEDFMRKLSNKITPEALLSRVSGASKDASLIPFLEKEFPAAAATIKDNLTNQILAKASYRTPEGRVVDPQDFLKSFKKMSPEARQQLFPPGASDRINAIAALHDALPSFKSSGTAGHLDNLWSKVPGGAMALASMLTGHNPAVGFMLGQVGKWAMRDAPDAMRLGMLKFLGKSGPVDAGAFKAMTDFVHSAIKGESKLTSVTKSLFDSSKILAPVEKEKLERQRDKLKDKVDDFGSDNSKLTDLNQDYGYYMPEHAGAVSQITAQATNYLNTLKPNTAKLGVLNPANKPNVLQKERYNRALDIANNPLSVFNHAKNGTLTNNDVIDLYSMYPGLHSRISQKLTSELSNQMNKKANIPYKLRIGLSMLMGEPLDQSLTPQSLQLTMGNATMGQDQASQQGGQVGAKPKAQAKSLTKMSTLEATPGQTRSLEKSTLS